MKKKGENALVKDHVNALKTAASKNRHITS